MWYFQDLTFSDLLNKARPAGRPQSGSGAAD
jgi:hypothetical protein